MPHPIRHLRRPLSLRPHTCFGAWWALGAVACGATAPPSSPSDVAQGTQMVAEASPVSNAPSAASPSGDGLASGADDDIAAYPPAPPPPSPYPAPEAPRDESALTTGAGEDALAPAPAAPMRAARPGSEGTGAPRPPVLVAPPSRPAPAGPVRAGEWDDNANWREFNAYLAGQVHLPLEPVDVSRRRFIVVRDRAGKPLPNCSVTVGESAGQGPTLALTTSAEGRAWFFPRAEGFVGSRFEARVRCAGSEATQAFVVDRPDGVVDVKLDVSRPRAPRVVDVAFILDTTGSMGEEIEAVKETIRRATGLFRNLGAQIRIALVEYKDNRDAFVTRVYGFSTDLARFSQQVDGLYAAGGGDTPENANRGLSVALSDLSWSRTSVARMAFLIGDAPPHLDDPQEVSYAASMRRANRRGIKVYTIAASGMDATGQAVWRQIAQYTGATNMFVERGGAGPQSRGGGDPKSSCGGTQTDFRSGNLHELVTEKVRGAVAALDRDPLRIAGVGQDENAKPCRERLVLAR